MFELDVKLIEDRVLKKVLNKLLIPCQMADDSLMHVCRRHLPHLGGNHVASVITSCKTSTTTCLSEFRFEFWFWFLGADLWIELSVFLSEFFMSRSPTGCVSRIAVRLILWTVLLQAQGGCNSCQGGKWKDSHLLVILRFLNFDYNRLMHRVYIWFESVLVLQIVANRDFFNESFSGIRDYFWFLLLYPLRKFSSL